MRGQRREGGLEEKAAVEKDPETLPQGGPPGSGPAPCPLHFAWQQLLNLITNATLIAAVPQTL